MQGRGGDWPILRRALRANAVLSGAAGVVSIIARGHLAPEFGVGSWWLAALGAVLAGFALSLAWLASRAVLLPGLVRAVVAMDLGWVGATALALLVFGGSITATGVAVAITVALAVGALAFWQLAGLRAALSSAA